MNEKQMTALVTMDRAGDIVVDMLIRFLEQQGVMARAEFTEFLQEALSKWESQGMEPRLFQMLTIKARALEASASEPPRALN